ncbi:class I SAM-dependent methyltransferase [Zavarzinia compransoris]|uniref:class I SAM-dependent methyltransferase n=1 Tax=Zavarzinia marina TaxID=2911065 RepID=UPI001F47A1B3|nr:class I SAM-dependent methyltransferase [Zavarzinia marina]MCF4166411.1 class I SAM-dependent methyltransferase [Zavarzinia marina]
MTAFSDAAAEDYDGRIARMAPGYTLALELVTALARCRFPEDARVLLAGSGTGTELLALAAAGPGWRFTAVEPSPAMMASARGKIAAAGLDHRVTFVEAMLDEAPPEPHDAAVSALVLHFIPDDGAKAGFMAALAARLAPRAPLLLTDFAAFDLPDGCYDRWLLDRGVEAEVVARAADWRRRVWQPVTPERVRGLAASAGFEDVRPFFQALGFHGLLASRADA